MDPLCVQEALALSSAGPQRDAVAAELAGAASGLAGSMRETVLFAVEAAA